MVQEFRMKRSTFAAQFGLGQGAFDGVGIKLIDLAE
jgi:hypothetical protein